MSFDKSTLRQLEAVVNARGKIISWKCSAYNWSKLAENPEGLTDNTKFIFENHDCEQHPKKQRAHHFTLRLQKSAATPCCA